MDQNAKLQGICDTHIHLAQIKNYQDFLAGAKDTGMTFCHASVSRDDALKARELFEVYDIVHVGTGLHPWFIEIKDRSTLEQSTSKLISEVGLDKKEAQDQADFEFQKEFFTSVLDAHDKREIFFSIHAVQAVTDVLDIYEKKPRCGTYCIHWFSGTSEELNRAKAKGFYFSVNFRMIHTRRGQDYVRQLPADRLLLESDWPRGALFPKTIEASWDSYAEQMSDLINSISNLKHCDMHEQLLDNQKRALPWL